jgi:tRNA dimethylallyltransferase
MSMQKIIIILGPTASGKSDLAVRLAHKIGGEIISADSRQVYTGLNIGSGKITKKEMMGIPHYCLDIANPKKQYSVAAYEKAARHAIKKILHGKKIPIIVGGSGMYIDAILYGAPYPEVPPNPSFRKKLEKKSAAALFSMLQKKDPVRASSIDRYNLRRLIRALEIIAATKKPIPPLIKNPRYEALFLGTYKSPKNLTSRINRRLRTRIAGGMIQEVKKLLRGGVSHARLFELGLEYRFISEYIRNGELKKEMIKNLSRAILQYSKRQATWFRQYPQTVWIQNREEAFREAKKFLRLFPEKLEKASEK